jgi:alpha-glucoside transport system substrate-binding protein
MAKRLWSTGVIAVVVMILVGACSTGSATPTPGATASGPAASATAKPPAAVPSLPTGMTELDAALANPPAYTGKTVTIQTQWIGGEGTAFAASVADFAKASGIKIQIDSIGSSNETVLKTRIDGGNPPDIAQLAQPTPILAYGAAGKAIDIATLMDPTKLTASHPSIGLVTVNGKIWGIPYKQDVKSAIWYPQKAFKAAGYTVPTTWDDLIKLSDKIIADGKGNPWCISAGGPGDATGWQLTDWVEEVLLKTKGLDFYNQWAQGQVKFSDPGVKAAFDQVAKIFFTDKYVFGGPQAIVNTDQKTTMDPMFNPGNGDMSAPKCWMQKIPFWYGPDFFPDQRASGGTTPSVYTIGADGDVAIMPFPTIDPAQTNAEISGDTFMVLKDRPEVRAVAQFLSTPEGLENWIRNPGAISANNTTPKDWYAGNYKLSVAADIVAKAAGLGFDASDLMPAAVGSGTFWTQTVAWVNNNGTNTDAVLQAIDASWPAQ